MGLEENLGKLKRITNELSVLSGIISVLSWDQQVYMPTDGVETRGEQLAMLSGLMHDKITSQEFGRIIDDLVSEIPDLDADDLAAREVKLAKKQYDLQTKVPKDLVVEASMLRAKARGAWLKAKLNNDYAHFEPFLKQGIELTLRRLEYFKPFEHPYDVLLDEYEPGMKKDEVQAIFDALRPRQVELIQRIAKLPQVDDSAFHKRFPIDGQARLGNFIANRFGMPKSRTRIDETEHPFTIEMGYDDVRITTHYYEDQVLSALMSTAHEAGHALYELGIKRDWHGSFLGQSISLGVHESQSRLWENMVARSKPFWEFFYPLMQVEFPTQLEGVSLDDAWRAVNKVKPSLVRIEADEATYNLHIMLRMELEIAMIEGRLDTKDLPTAWNDRMQDYLGLTPPNDTLGCLQDVHWSGNTYGYFPTYALGNLISAQWWASLRKELPDYEEQLRRGNFDELREWLVRNVHIHGSRYDTQDLLLKATGERLNPDHYMQYLNDKYSQVYQF